MRQIFDAFPASFFGSSALVGFTEIATHGLGRPSGTSLAGPTRRSLVPMLALVRGWQFAGVKSAQLNGIVHRSARPQQISVGPLNAVCPTR